MIPLHSLGGLLLLQAWFLYQRPRKCLVSSTALLWAEISDVVPGMCSDPCDGQSGRLDPDVIQLIRWQQLERLLTW